MENTSIRNYRHNNCNFIKCPILDINQSFFLQIEIPQNDEIFNQSYWTEYYKISAFPTFNEEEKKYKTKFCSKLRLKNTNSIIKDIQIFLFTKNGRDFYIMPDCSGKSIILSIFINEIKFTIRDSFYRSDFSEIVKKFFSLYSENKYFMEKFIHFKEFPIADIGNIIQIMFVYLSQPPINGIKLLLFPF